MALTAVLPMGIQATVQRETEAINERLDFNMIAFQYVRLDNKKTSGRKGTNVGWFISLCATCIHTLSMSIPIPKYWLSKGEHRVSHSNISPCRVEGNLHSPAAIYILSHRLSYYCF